MLMPSTTAHTKRVVFVHDDGIHQILGTCDGELPVTLVPDGAAGIQVRDRIIPFASLFRVTARAAYFKAPTVPTSAQTFHAEQK